MKMNYKIKRKIIAFAAIIFAITALFFIGIIILKMGLNDTKTISVDYQETKSINYKVYLKENSFFETPYLGENQVYITSLIDYLDITFNYSLQYSDYVSGSYDYYIKGIVSANQSGNTSTNYWSKEYDLTDKKTVDFTGQNAFIITENIQVDYQKYNDLLASFKETYGLSTDGNLTIELVLESTATSDLITKKIEIPATMELDIPLTKLSVEASIDTNNNSTSNSVSESVKKTDKWYSIFKIAGIVLIGIAVIFTLVFVYWVLTAAKKQDLYAKKLKKILSTYNSIIINTSSVPDISQLNVIKVKSFDDLIDAHSEVRMPINLIESNKKNESIFLLIADKYVWMYVLREEDLYKKDKTK